jgi:signal transduction histidine kinase/CheY-like chemotaxis protein
MCGIFFVATMLIYTNLVASIAVTLVAITLSLTSAKLISNFVENQTEKSHAVMKKLLESMDTMIVITEIENDFVIYLNDSFKNEFSLTSDIIGKPCRSILNEGATGRCGRCPKNDDILDYNKLISWEYFHAPRQKHYKFSGRFIDWPDGRKVFMEQCVDITELKTSIVELNKARDSAEGANKAKSEFLSNMSHEIRTPLNSIVGFSELAMDDNISAKTKQYLENILQNSDWLLQIINNILDLSKIESGNAELENIPFSPNDLFAACRAIIAPRANEKGIILRFNAEPPRAGKVPLGDPTRLLQVFVNLLSNAVKFTEKGEVNLSVKVIATTDSTITARFAVKDTGIGMMPEQIERVFKPFMQAELGTTRKYGGTGLGLAITKNIIELMGGKLSVESQPYAGSVFSFELTFDTITADSSNFSEKPVENEELKKPTFSGEALLCEDNDMNQQVIKEHLERVGFSVTIAENGKAGVEQVTNREKSGDKQFSLIIMDIHMPVMDGIEASEKIFALNTGIPIIAMSANVLSQETDAYEQCGICDYICKPFTSQELWKCLVKHLCVDELNIVDEKTQHEENEKMQKQLKVRFVKSNHKLFAKIMQALNTGDSKTAHRLVHTLKSNAGQIGELKLQALAQIVETKLIGGLNLLSGKNISELEAELKIVISKLMPLLTEDNDFTSYVGTDKTRELFKTLKPLLIDKDAECLNYVEELRAIPGTKELAEQIGDYNFSDALTILNELMNS